MRRRVLQATVAAVAVAVLLLGFPLAFLGAQFVLANEMAQLQGRVDTLARNIDNRLAQNEPIPQSLLDSASEGRPGELPAYVFVNLPDGEQMTAGEVITGRANEAADRTDQNATVALSTSFVDSYWNAAQIVLLVVAASVVAFAAGIAMAVWQANRLSAPLVYLAASAEQLGSGQVRPRLEPSGVEEIDLVAAELARSSDRLAGRLAAERQFASDASHQLRTPLTALSMRLEEISMASDDPAVQEEARISLEQVERLVTVVDDLLTQSRRAQGGTTEAVRLIEVVRQQEEEWVPTFAQAGRKLVVDVPEGYQVLATPGALAQVLATLIENSLKHGAGTTTVRARPSGTSGAVAVEVGDEGEGVSDEMAPRVFERGATSGAGTGLGLALARDLAAADGGRLELAQRRPPIFALFLAGVPRTLDPRVVLPTGTLISARGGRRRRRGRGPEVEPR
ncbi:MULTISPECIES: ATP-binding protein [Oerskovia]|uniref:Signal transduction histidine-protein kinase/phosphatase MprB n=1 Tax=Oerskovia merdavium TaxID=2762227 RepID=A0ABR8TU45_9CELL|nr:ATP-binding protein [Oerskovia merdavium]MBD7979299.1 HAMP domain-containing histidine kinase [Oerskovia merdavium]